MVTMSAVWDRTSAFLSDHAGAIAAIAVPTIYLPDVLGGVLDPAVAGAAPGLKLGLGLLSLAFVLIGVFGQTALIALLLEPERGTAGAFGRGAARFPAMVGIWLLLLVAALLLCVPMIGLAAAGGVDFSALSSAALPNLAPGSALLISLYGLILFVVACWLGARLAALGAVIVAERRGLGAISHAFRLTRGLAARIFGTFLLFTIVAVVAGMAVKAVFGSVFRIAFGGEGAINTASVLTALASGLVSAAFTIVLTLFCAQLYLAVRDRAGAEADRVPAAA